MPRGISTTETFALRKYKKGDVFYSHKEDRQITALASHEGVKVKTERMIAIDTEHNERIERLTKVTIL